MDDVVYRRIGEAPSTLRFRRRGIGPKPVDSGRHIGHTAARRARSEATSLVRKIAPLEHLSPENWRDEASTGGGYFLCCGFDSHPGLIRWVAQSVEQRVESPPPAFVASDFQQMSRDEHGQRLLRITSQDQRVRPPQPSQDGPAPAKPCRPSIRCEHRRRLLHLRCRNAGSTPATLRGVV